MIVSKTCRRKEPSLKVPYEVASQFLWNDKKENHYIDSFWPFRPIVMG